ncbi:MAG: 50S ribosomal protein L4 [Candidatus Omnitrophota bacterium]
MLNSDGKKVETIELDKGVFNGEVNKGVLHQAVVMYNANTRRGTASTKTISDVRGGGKKPWKQKGTGRARVSSIRSPLWVGGGVVFGPHPRDYRYRAPKQVLRHALASSLNAKLNEKNFIAVDAITVDEPKTKNFKKILTSLKAERKTLVVLASVDENVKRSSRNLKDVVVKSARNVNALDVLLADTVVVSKMAIPVIVKRLKGKA